MNRDSFVRVYDTTYSLDTVDPYGVKVRLEGSSPEAISRLAQKMGLAAEQIESHDTLIEEGTFGAIFEDLISLLENGSKINAIKRFRELTGWGLRDSKEAIDRVVGVGGRIATNRIASGVEF